ncbi:MAG TPA: pseudouridine synthase, partial [Thermomonas sp.]|nr:pseudouridine synthase [Thermomonas sp.]
MKLVKHLANLGYGSRKDVQWMFREGRITDAAGEVLYADDPLDHDNVRVDGEPLDLAPGLLLMLHKPVGYTCASKDPGRIVYDLLPPRFRLRSPVLSTVGRLDRETSGLLLLTDDGQLLHRIISPKSKLPKVYLATLASDLRGDEAATFASGKLMLDNDATPLLPAELEV